MKLTKNQKIVMDNIFKLLGKKEALCWELKIKSCLLNKSIYRYAKNETLVDFLSDRFLILSIIEQPIGNLQKKNSVKVLFGKNQRINFENKELTINFKYAKDIVEVILNSINANSLNMYTI